MSQHKDILDNFILHLTHCSEDGGEDNYDEQVSYTPRELYAIVNEFIEIENINGENIDNN